MAITASGYTYISALDFNHSCIANVSNSLFFKHQLLFKLFWFHGDNPPFLYKIWFELAAKFKAYLPFIFIILIILNLHVQKKNVKPF